MRPVTSTTTRPLRRAWSIAASALADTSPRDVNVPSKSTATT